MKIIPNVPPKIFTLSAITVGYLLIDDTTANEQNALGNWLMLTAQVLCTNAFYKQVQEERGIGNLNQSILQNKTKYSKHANYNKYNINNNYQHNMKSNNSDNIDCSVFSDDNITADTIEILQKMVDAIQKEINELKS